MPHRVLSPLFLACLLFLPSIAEAWSDKVINVTDGETLVMKRATLRSMNGFTGSIPPKMTSLTGLGRYASPGDGSF